MIDDIKFALHIVIHPIDGFWDMRYEKRGKMKAALTIVLLTIATFIFERLVTGFLFDPTYNASLDILFQFRKVLFPIVLFCVANWSITTLMDGEGRAKDIVMATCYALTPLILVRIPLTIITNFMTYKEVAYINFLDQLSMIWLVFLLFLGIMTVHRYSVTKTIFIMLLTIVSMAIILFISLIFFSLASEITGFVYTIYKEMTLRL